MPELLPDDERVGAEERTPDEELPLWLPPNEPTLPERCEGVAERCTEEERCAGAVRGRCSTDLGAVLRMVSERCTLGATRVLPLSLWRGSKVPPPVRLPPNEPCLVPPERIPPLC